MVKRGVVVYCRDGESYRESVREAKLPAVIAWERRRRTRGCLHLVFLFHIVILFGVNGSRGFSCIGFSTLTFCVISSCKYIIRIFCFLFSSIRDWNSVMAEFYSSHIPPLVVATLSKLSNSHSKSNRWTCVQIWPERILHPTTVRS